MNLPTKSQHEWDEAEKLNHEFHLVAFRVGNRNLHKHKNDYRDEFRDTVCELNDKLKSTPDDADKLDEEYASLLKAITEKYKKSHDKLLYGNVTL
jgi:chaperonin cofactor prefoldin